MKTLPHPWPSVRGDARNSGCRIAEPDLSDIRPWTFASDARVFSEPIIGSGERIYAGSVDGTFYAIDGTTGRELWRFQTGGVIDSAACIDGDDFLYVPSGDAVVYKLSPSGKEVWRFDLAERRVHGTMSTIHWWEGGVTLGPNGLLYAGNDDFCLYAIAPDGALKWSYATGLNIWSAPAFGNALVYFASFDMRVYALDQETGAPRWTRLLSNLISSSPAVGTDGTVYVGCFDGFVYALDGRDGRILWKTPLSGPVYASAALAPDGNIFIGSGDGFLHALEGGTGKPLWSFKTGAPVWGSASIGPDLEKKSPFLVYVASGGVVFAVDPAGSCRWSHDSYEESPRVRRGSVNASMALGTRGLATGTGKGGISYIPYGEHLRNREKIAVAAPRRRAREAGAPPLIAKGSAFRIENMHFTSPAIIDAFDEAGIASLSIEVTVEEFDPDSGRFTARGSQAFGVDTTGKAIGVPFARTHQYSFSGVVKDGSWSMEAADCDFEITAFPIFVNRLVYAGSTAERSAEAGIVTLTIRGRGLLRRYLAQYALPALGWFWQQFVRHSKRNVSFSILSLSRSAGALMRILAGRKWRPWGLVNEDGDIVARGECSIVPR